MNTINPYPIVPVRASMLFDIMEPPLPAQIRAHITCVMADHQQSSWGKQKALYATVTVYRAYICGTFVAQFEEQTATDAPLCKTESGVVGTYATFARRICLQDFLHTSRLLESLPHTVEKVLISSGEHFPSIPPCMPDCSVMTSEISSIHHPGIPRPADS